MTRPSGDSTIRCWSRLGGHVMVVIVAGACQQPPASFYDRAFTCEVDQPRESCGTDQEGRPMTCFSGGLAGGGEPFCAPSCSPSSQATEGKVCVAGAALLSTCRPSADGATPGTGACGDPALACYRTDLLADEGICVLGKVCNDDAACGGNGRICGSTLARLLFGSSAPIKTDHLHCLQTGCAQLGIACPSGQACLPHFIPPASQPPDICVPRCGPDLQCPPNHFCLRKVSGAHQPDICLPGMPSYRCTGDIDCLVGTCVATGEGFSLCTTECTSDADCTAVQALREEVHCSLKTRAGKSYCVRVGAFDGTFCNEDANCAEGEVCTRARPHDSLLCRPQCGPGRACPNRGGLPQSCVDWFGPPVCHPAQFGYPCNTERRCVGVLECVTGLVLDGQDQLRTQPICSHRCRQNSDCRDDEVFGRHGGWCDHGVCTPRRFPGQLCAGDIECESDQCRLSTDPGEQAAGVSRCVAL